METKDSPFLEFSRAEWGGFRKDTPMTLSEGDVQQLHGQIEEVSREEVEAIYLPLSRLLNLYVTATQELHNVTGAFLDHPEPKVPYVIAVAGSVAVGKSTTSRILKALLSRWPDHPKVDIVTTDGYLYSNAALEQHDLMTRKGFPESYDLRRFITFLRELKSGKADLKVPMYSHHAYDVLPDEYQIVNQPDIVIVEGLNVLQVAPDTLGYRPREFVSDYFDFSVYVDADIDVVKDWFVRRFMTFREAAKEDAGAFFYQFTKFSEEDALEFATGVWNDINELNLRENILPFRSRARAIFMKNADHSVQKVLLRKL